MAVAKQSFSDREVIVPPSLPLILKQFCKAAIRTQPYDLLRWSTSYFQALADGEEPPTKLRLEYPPPNTIFDYNKSLSVETILRRWDCLCLDRRDLNLILMIGKFQRKCQVKKFLAIAVGLLGSSLCETMIMICELFTHEPEGGSAMVPVTFFLEIYGYLAGLCCDGSERNPSDEDATEFIMCDSEYSGQELNSEQFFIDLSVTSQDTSQDTEADINLDLELVSRKDTNSSKVNTTPQSSESYVTKKKMIKDEREQNFSNKETSKMKSNEISAIDVESNKRSRFIDEQNLKGENTSAKSSSSISGESCSEKQSTKYKVERSMKRKTIDPKLLKYYPNVPGIGSRLSAEEVASVAIWLSECARVQEGMVGPRNLRHMNCPSLDRQEISGS
ncbi:Ropporin-1-like protein [Melipona quadrifasciata]|uniref:Ropporin-1-like protein n=1 Tax=Melipona quadrifasciata TaxID=166423 RepID=A0A0M8ZQN6_9HYME|nr:Ropporin-1-like protein [Melipona quadrifasciata]